MNRLAGPLIAFGFACGVIALALMVPAHGAECPPDRPIKRTVNANAAWCTLKACVGKLVCPSQPPMLPLGAAKSLIGADCYYAPAAGDCNTCSAAVHEICLSQDDLDKAK